MRLQPRATHTTRSHTHPHTPTYHHRLYKLGAHETLPQAKSFPLPARSFAAIANALDKKCVLELKNILRII